MKNKGLILIVIGVLCLSFSIGLTAYNYVEAERAESVTDKTFTALVSHIENAVEDSKTQAEDAIAPNSDASLPDHIINPSIEMPTVIIDGEYYIGYLEIPSLELTLPINDGWSYPDLKNTPCRYSGSAYKKDLVICAHNYSAHFGRLKSLKSGDKIFFTDAKGNVFCYKVEVIETLLPTSIEQMTSGEWDLSLFTCTQGGSYRVTVRCSLIEE